MTAVGSGHRSGDRGQPDMLRPQFGGCAGVMVVMTRFSRWPEQQHAGSYALLLRGEGPSKGNARRGRRDPAGQISLQDISQLTYLSRNVRSYRFVRGFPVGVRHPQPDLWDFCGLQGVRPQGSGP